MRTLFIVPLVAMCLLGDARAEKKVDWSQYLESPAERAKSRRTTPTAEPAPAATTAKKAKPTRGKKATKQRPVAQAKAKRKPARRR